MTAQDRVQFTIGQLTVSNFALQEQIEELKKENAALKMESAEAKAAMKNVPEKPKLKEVSKDA